MPQIMFSGSHPVSFHCSACDHLSPQGRISLASISWVCFSPLSFHTHISQCHFCFWSVSSSWFHTLPQTDQDSFEFQSCLAHCLWPPPHLLSATNYRNLFSVPSLESLWEYWTVPDSGQTLKHLLRLEMCLFWVWSSLFMSTHLALTAQRPLTLVVPRGPVPNSLERSNHTSPPPFLDSFIHEIDPWFIWFLCLPL